MKGNKLASLLCMLALLISSVCMCWGTEGESGSVTDDEGIMPISAELEEDIDPDVTIIGFSINDGRGLEEVMPQGSAVSCMNEDMHSASTRPCVKSAKVSDAGKYSISLDLRNNSSEYDSVTNVYIGLDSDFFSVPDDLGIQNSVVGESSGVIELLKSDSSEKVSSFVQGKEFSSCEYVLSISTTISKGETPNIKFELDKGTNDDVSTFAMPVLVVSKSDDTLSESVHTSIINGSISEEVEIELGKIEILTDNSTDKIEEVDGNISVEFDSDSMLPITVKETIKNTSGSVAQYNKIVLKHYITVNSSLSVIDFNKENIELTYSGEGKDDDTFYVGEETDGSLVIYSLYPLEPGEELTVSLKGTVQEGYGSVNNYTLSFDVEAEPASLLQGSDKSTAWGKEFTVEDGKLAYLPDSFTSTTKAGATDSKSTILTMSTIENPIYNISDEESEVEEVRGNSSATIPTIIGLVLVVMVISIVAVSINKKPKKSTDDEKKKSTDEKK